MNPDLSGVIWVIGGLAFATLLADRPLTFGTIISIPWFWMAWTAAEQGAPFGSCVLFLDGVALLLLFLSMHLRSADLQRESP